jgi:pseudouridine synthase
MLRQFVRGVYHQGEKLKAERARLLSGGPSQGMVELELAEGKYHEVRRLFESQGLRVGKLQRIQIGKIKLGELRPGRWRTLTGAEIKSLLAEG